jgi:hypothetical protein
MECCEYSPRFQKQSSIFLHNFWSPFKKNNILWVPFLVGAGLSILLPVQNTTATICGTSLELNHQTLPQTQPSTLTLQPEHYTNSQKP